MLSRAQNTFHHNPRLRGPVSSVLRNISTPFKYGMKNCFSLGKYIKYTLKECTFPSFMPKVGRLHSGNIKTHLALHLSAFLNILLTKVIGETNSTKHSSPT